MEPRKLSSKFGLTFDDILLIPGYSDFLRKDIDLSTQFSKRIMISIPLVSSPMDTVTESRLAIELAKLGGIGIIHRNLSVGDQALEVKKVIRRSVNKKLLVGAAVGVSKGFEERIKALVRVGVDAIIVDSAHGYSKGVIETIKFIKKYYKNIDAVSGNIATLEGARALIAAGVDGLRVGMGPGAICTTRIISGIGIPQITAIMEASRVAKKFRVPIIADGGIKYSGDMVKALAVGASAVMMGGYFAACLESPGKIVRLNQNQLPSRFKAISHLKKYYEFKKYRGMGSEGAMKKGAKIKSEDEYHGNNYKDKVLVAEGVEGLVPMRGSIKDLVDQAIGGIKSGMYYTGAKNILELQKKARVIQITQASLVESHPHDIFVTNSGKNYS
jgi:IMP dehydrogenase